MKEKQVMITRSLFLELVKYFEGVNEDRYDWIREQLEKKLDALASHNLYSTYITATTEEEREVAREKYLANKRYDHGLNY